jgi:hypothetical protein
MLKLATVFVAFLPSILCAAGAGAGMILDKPNWVWLIAAAWILYPNGIEFKQD